MKIAQLTGVPYESIQEHASVTLIKAVIAQRSIKETEEIEQIENALDIAYEMQTAAMKRSKPGLFEREIAGVMEGIALSYGGRLAFPTIFSIHGETLHNHGHGNQMSAGDIAVNDSGAESPLHYASDITRTIPISGTFTQRQKEIYSIVLNAQAKAIEAIQPGTPFRDVHLLRLSISNARIAGTGINPWGCGRSRAGERAYVVLSMWVGTYDGTGRA